MAQYRMTLVRHSFEPGASWTAEAGHHALWIASGAVDVGGQRAGADQGLYAMTDTAISALEPTEALQFSVIQSVAEDTGTVLSAAFEVEAKDAIFRLDQVRFPPGARAYRHVHPGPGIRCLIAGTLEIKSEHHTETMTNGAAWFEDADSPVQATAGPAETAFVRAMILPLAFEGKPTLRLLDPDDEEKPRLQTNRRFIDQRVRLRTG